jgi:hypothetical protein
LVLLSHLPFYDKLSVRAGGVVVESAMQCSVLVSETAKRTCKLLACAARGVPVVTEAWLTSSAAAAAFTGQTFLTIVASTMLIILKK